MTKKEQKERAKENRVLIRNFEEINDFFKKHNREPERNKLRIVEYSLGARLGYIRLNEAFKATLKPYDRFGLL